MFWFLHETESVTWVD